MHVVFVYFLCHGVSFASPIPDLFSECWSLYQFGHMCKQTSGFSVSQERLVGEHLVQVPLLRNTRAVQEGDRLVWKRGAKGMPKSCVEASAKKRARQA